MRKLASLFLILFVALSTLYVSHAPVQAAGNGVFAPYIDVSPGSGSAIMQLASNGSGNKHYTLAFILGSGCNASWFGAFPMNTSEAAGIGTDINNLRAAGGDVIVSFGGAAAPELANVCPDAGSLQAQYQAVVSKYSLNRVDFDIEDFNPTAIDIRNKALKGLEAANPGLTVQYTLGVLQSGFTSSQTAVLNNAISNGTRVDLVNIMAMDYGQSVSDMGAAAISAAQAARSQLNGMGLSGTQLGITPMIGVNDSAGETFTLANASSLLSWANSNGIAELAFWSLGRDNGGCLGGGASASCSGVSQSTWQFSSIFQAFNSTTSNPPPGGPGGYTLCAAENGTCSFSGTATVAYGANGTFYFKAATNSIGCNNNTFGDPTPGVAKSCYYLASGSGPAGYSYCIGEGGTCSFSGTATVAYGANGAFNYKTATNSIACNNATFGDPISGVAKSCYYLVSGGGPAGYTFCANENGTCSFSGAANVAYGANGKFNYKTATNSIACNNNTFGDPIVGTAKACYYQLTTAPTPTFVPGASAWQPNVAYSVGQQVTYAGITYKCLQAHTSQVGWEPPNVPALWQKV